MTPKTALLALLASAALAMPALAADPSPVDQAIAACAQGLMAPADAGKALEGQGYTKAEAGGATTYTMGDIVVAMTASPISCSVSDKTLSTTAMVDKLKTLLGGTLPAEAKDANGCRSFDMGSGMSASVTSADAATCEADTGATLRLSAKG